MWKEDQKEDIILQGPTCQTISHPSEDGHRISLQHLRLFLLCGISLLDLHANFLLHSSTRVALVSIAFKDCFLSDSANISFKK